MNNPDDRRKFDRDKIKPLNVGIVQYSGCSACAMETTDALNFKSKVPINIVMSPWNYDVTDHYSKEKLPDMDICFIEGAIGNSHHEEELLMVRKSSKYLVGIGTCAASEKMNIGMLKNSFSNLPAKLPEDVVKMDYRIKGCKLTEKSITKNIIELITLFKDDYYQYLSEGEEKV